MIDKPEGFDLYPTYYVAKLETTATRCKELLRRVYADATSHGHCPFCRMECTAYSFGSWGEREYKHANDCELAKELADE